MDQHDEKLLTTPAPAFDAHAALARFRERTAREGIAPARRRAGWTWLAALPWARPLAATMGALAIVAALSLTGLADTILTVFEPQRIQVVQVDVRQLNGIPDMSAYGTFTWIAQPSLRPVADAAGAATMLGATPLVPRALPANVPSTPHYYGTAQGKATFQFDEAKARAAAAKAGATPPPMPAGIASTTLTLTGGPGVLQGYGAAGSGGTQPTTVGGMSGPTLVIAQVKAPLVTSNGASVDELRDYFLAQPGIPPALAAQIRAIGDPVRTLVVPIGLDMGAAKTVTVRGTQGYVVGDSTGLGSGVIWLENGYVMGVLGTLSQSDLLALANGLR